MSERKFRVGILGSGDKETGEGGSTMEAFLRNCALGIIAIEVGLIICNNSEIVVPGFYKKVHDHNEKFKKDIKVLTINSFRYPAEPGEMVKKGAQTHAEAVACADALKQDGADIFLLAGFMKKVGKLGLKGLNTHPGPLPLTEGLHGVDVQRKVLDEDFPYSAHTVHEVTDEYDQGRIVAWRPVLVTPGETKENLFGRVQNVEKACLPGDVERYLQELSSTAA